MNQHLNFCDMKIEGNIIQLERLELKNLISEAVAIGVRKALTDTTPNKKYLSKNQAYQKYGRRLIDRWIKESLIKEIKDGDRSHKIRLDAIELEKIAAFSNRTSFYRSREICR